MLKDNATEEDLLHELKQINVIQNHIMFADNRHDRIIVSLFERTNKLFDRLIQNLTIHQINQQQDLA